jgi:hypothetical protein
MKMLSYSNRFVIFFIKMELEEGNRIFKIFFSAVVPVSAGQSNRPLGIYGSYYKLFRCSDGKLRLNLISEEEYLESKKRPISVDDVSSTTDVVPIICPHGHHHGHHPTAIQPVIMQQPAPGKRLHCVPEQSSQQPRIKRQRTGKSKRAR